MIYVADMENVKISVSNLFASDCARLTAGRQEGKLFGVSVIEEL